MICERCGQPHARCTGHNRAGQPCRRHSLENQTVCDLHGGKSPQALGAAERRGQERAALVALESFGLPVEVDPHTALLQELHRTAGAVAWLGAIVADIDQADIVWGQTREKTGGDDAGTTHEAKPSIWYEMWLRERKHFVDVARACASAGVEERLIRHTEEQGQQLAGVVSRILGGISTALALALAEHVEAQRIIESMWSGLVGEIVPRELRAAGQDSSS